MNPPCWASRTVVGLNLTIPRNCLWAKVEHPFLYVKRRFGYRKVRYRGLAKNIERIALLLGFANLLVAGRYSTA